MPADVEQTLAPGAASLAATPQAPNWMWRVYGLVMLALLPLMLLRQWWRGRAHPEFRAHAQERRGRYPESLRATCTAAHFRSDRRSSEPAVVWVHAVSLGETRASLSLLRALRARWPAALLLLTHMTPTGRAAGAGFAIDNLLQCYLPYDAPGAMARFFDQARPDLGILMETEIWPGLVRAARQRACPLILVNARLSEHSARGYARFGRFARAVFAGLAATGAQTEDDAQRLARLSARAIEVTGNLKFDLPIPAGEAVLAGRFRARWGRRPVWLAASTREGEEALLLDALQTLPAQGLLVLVPRHPERFDAVAALVAARGFTLQRRSSDEAILPTTRVVLGDSLGELGAYYGSVDLAFVGGSLLPFGGQNLIEACARGCPVLIGPHTFNFSQSAAGAIAAGAALRVDSAQTLASAAGGLLESAAARAVMSAAGLAFVEAHQGATVRTLALIERAWRAGAGGGADARR